MSKKRTIDDVVDIKVIKERFTRCREASLGNYEAMIEDLRFLEGDQWPVELKNQRDQDGRPCLIINKLPTFLDQTVGDQRQNRPRIKITPVDSKADPETAKIFTGLIKNIENVSNADIAYDTAFEGAAGCGFGAFRIVTEYSDENSFDQDICIKRIKNQFTVYFDPDCKEHDRSDAEFAFVTDKIPRDVYKARFPNADPCDFDADRDKTDDWVAADHVRVCEYFYRVPKTSKMYLIRFKDDDSEAILKEKPADGTEGEDWEVVKERDVETSQIKWLKCNGREIIEKSEDWAGKYIPLIGVFGKELNIEGKTIYRGMIRHAKDPQRLYNYNRSLGAEMVSLAPKTPFLVTPKQIQGFEGQWKTQHKRNYPYLYYNHQQNAPMPQRNYGPPVATGIQAEVMISDQELHDTTGLPLANLGKGSQEKSGKAIQAKQREGDIAQFSYMDNLTRALKYAGRILVDLIPKIYDTERVLRVINEDDSTDFAPVNQKFTDEKDGNDKIFSLNAGKYDVVVNVGPSYTTLRQESAESMMNFLKVVPDVAPMIADLIAKNQDWAGSEELQERLKKFLPPGVADDSPAAPGSQGPDGGVGQAPPPDPAQLQAQNAAETLTEVEIETADVKLQQEKADLRKKEAEADLAEIKARQGGNEVPAPRFNQ